MVQYDEQSKYGLLDRNSESSDGETYHADRELHRRPDSWVRRNFLSLAIFCMMLYVALLETINIARQSTVPDNVCKLLKEDQPSKLQDCLLYIFPW